MKRLEEYREREKEGECEVCGGSVWGVVDIAGKVRTRYCKECLERVKSRREGEIERVKEKARITEEVNAGIDETLNREVRRKVNAKMAAELVERRKV